MPVSDCTSMSDGHSSLIIRGIDYIFCSSNLGMQIFSLSCSERDDISVRKVKVSCQ